MTRDELIALGANELRGAECVKRIIGAAPHIHCGCFDCATDWDKALNAAYECGISGHVIGALQEGDWDRLLEAVRMVGVDA